MSENAKTLTFVIVGLVAIGVGLFTRPSSAELDVTSRENEYLTKDLSVDDAKRLKIVRFDEDTATIRDFEVAEQDGLWTIPSKDGYPADAARQMAEAVTSLTDLKILTVKSTSDADHEEYGVIDPASQKLQPGQKGVGTRVTLSNDQNKPLVDLIVGKAVKGAEGQRYVREAGRSLVYAVEFDRSKLSTSFEDWIEKDLLKLNSFDLQQVDIKDYSAELVQVMTQNGPGIGIDMNDRSELVLAYNEADAKWTPVKLRSFDKTKGERGDYVDFALADDEELNDKTLNDLKTALDDLQIVDVVRKPTGLSEDLKAGEDFVKNNEAKIELMMKGFTPEQKTVDGQQAIISSDGEVVATMKDGTEYVLRFGNLTSADGGGQAEDAAKAEVPADPLAAAQAAAAKKDSDVHRYMFVMARYNRDVIKKPEEKPLPELPAEGAKPAEGASAAAPAETPAEVASATEAATPAADAAAPEAEGAEAPAGEATPGAEAPAAEVAAAPAADSAAPPAAEAASPEKNPEVEKIKAERARIEEENNRNRERYDEQVKKGVDNVKALNLRFGDWYFVIDDAEFQKLRLGREDVIKKKEPPKAEGEAAGAESATPQAPPVGLPVVPGAAP
jgi:hypothetical protein